MMDDLGVSESEDGEFVLLWVREGAVVRWVLVPKEE